MSSIARTLSVLTLLMLPGCDPVDELSADELADLTDDEIAARDFDFDVDLDPDWYLDIDFDFDGYIPPMIDLNTLPQYHAWNTGLDSQIIVLGSTESTTEVFAYQIDRDTLDVVATRRASTRGGDLRRGQAIPLRDYSGATWAVVDPTLKDFMTQAQVSFTEFGGNVWMPLPKGPPKGWDPILEAKLKVLTINIAMGH